MLTGAPNPSRAVPRALPTVTYRRCVPRRPSPKIPHRPSKTANIAPTIHQPPCSNGRKWAEMGGIPQNRQRRQLPDSITPFTGTTALTVSPNNRKPTFPGGTVRFPGFPATAAAANPPVAIIAHTMRIIVASCAVSDEKRKRPGILPRCCGGVLTKVPHRV